MFVLPLQEAVEEFTDSYYTSHEARGKIVQLSDALRDELQALLLAGQDVVGGVDSGIYSI